MARPRYVRHRKFIRLRHSRRFLKWLDEQADRLEVEPEDVFNLMVASHLSYEKVENLDTFPEVPQNDTAPAITGTAEVGETLTVTPGEWTGEPEPTLSYQWFRDDGSEIFEIEGATSTTYEVTLNDVDHTLFVRELASNGYGSMFADSDATAEVPEPEPEEA